jgi:hypothetical protein
MGGALKNSNQANPVGVSKNVIGVGIQGMLA